MKNAKTNEKKINIKQLTKKNRNLTKIQNSTNRCHFDQNLNENYFVEAKIMLQKAKPQPKH